MNFYQDIIDRLYVWNTTKGDTNFADPYDFIEAKHFESNDKDFIFYERLLHEMPNHFDPMMRSDLLKEIILYCNRKIDSYKSDYEQPDFIYSISGEPLFFEIKNDKEGQALKPNEKCRKEHALDILNYAIVSIEGEVEHPDQNFYDNKFIKAINSTPNKAEEIRYINHHYSRAKKKNVFMRKIDNLFDRTRKYPTDEVLTQDARSILLEWYNSEIEKHPQLIIEQVERKNTSNIPEVENLVAWRKKYRRIKKEFETIENYPDKLSYWKTNLCSKENTYWNFIPRYFIKGDEQERLLPDNQICIFPENSSDKELFCDWIFNLIEEDDTIKKHSFNKLKLAFNETISRTPLPKEYILSELKEIEYQREKEQKNFENKLQIDTWAYYYGYISVVKGKKLWIDMDSELFFKLSLNITNGVADAYYYSFLKEKLALLENPPPQQTELKNSIAAEIAEKLRTEVEMDELFLRTEKIRKEKEGINSATQPNIFCKSMPLNIPIEHFKVFTEKLSKNKNPFLTIEQLNLFIDKAFKGNEKLPKQKFNQMPKGEKLLIQAVFYDFYNTNCFYYFNTMQCQDIFIKLLTDNFEGWDYKNVKANFTPKTKKRI